MTKKLRSDNGSFHYCTAPHLNLSQQVTIAKHIVTHHYGSRKACIIIIFFIYGDQN